MPFEDTAVSAANVLKGRRKASAAVKEGKLKLQQAIANKNVEEVKRALWYLSTTKMASTSTSQSQSQSQKDELELEQQQQQQQDTTTTVVQVHHVLIATSAIIVRISTTIKLPM